MYSGFLLCLGVVVFGTQLSHVDTKPASIVQFRVTNATVLGSCPQRTPKVAKIRNCLKKCRNDAECRGKRKKCVCDGPCGLSCLNPKKRCESLEGIISGKLEVIPSNKLGAIARYTCDEGYVLVGDRERQCQGDGKWSSLPPTCEGDFYCGPAPEIPNAKYDGGDADRFLIGTRLLYKCNNGFHTEGMINAMCIGEDKWLGPKLTCTARSCGPPGDIEHGRRIGDNFSHPARVTYFCDIGYTIIGKAFRQCLVNGKWSGDTPKCIVIRCPQVPAPKHGILEGALYTYNAIINFNCNRGYKLYGANQRRCTAHGTWDGDPARCELVDCSYPIPPIINGYLEGHKTTYGSVVIYRCKPGMLFVGPSKSTTCQADGEWSMPVPTCYNACEVPSILNGYINETTPGVLVEHGTRIRFACHPGHRLNQTKYSECNNGSWSHIPNCQPAACTVRPPYIRNGLVRYYRIFHGSRAKYKCNTGYSIVGTNTLQCEYGKWIGTKPYCEPIYCDYPGKIKHGKVMLIGVIGKYEYLSHARRIGQGQILEFQCNRGYKISGPSGATCIAGKWSPELKPKCLRGRHPKLLKPWLRGYKQNKTTNNTLCKGSFNKVWFNQVTYKSSKDC